MPAEGTVTVCARKVSFEANAAPASKVDYLWKGLNS